MQLQVKAAEEEFESQIGELASSIQRLQLEATPGAADEDAKTQEAAQADLARVSQALDDLQGAQAQFHYIRDLLAKACPAPLPAPSAAASGFAHRLHAAAGRGSGMASSTPTQDRGARETTGLDLMGPDGVQLELLSPEKTDTCAADHVVPGAVYTLVTSAQLATPPPPGLGDDGLGSARSRTPPKGSKRGGKDKGGKAKGGKEEGDAPAVVWTPLLYRTPWGKDTQVSDEAASSVGKGSKKSGGRRKK